MPLHEDEYAVRWCEALRRYSYPTVTFYFRHGQERRHEDTRGVERRRTYLATARISARAAGDLKGGAASPRQTPMCTRRASSPATCYWSELEPLIVGPPAHDQLFDRLAVADAVIDDLSSESREFVVTHEPKRRQLVHREVVDT